MPSGEDFDRILDACAIALDGRGTDGGCRRSEPTQRSSPRLRGVAQVVGQVATQNVKLVEATHQAGRLGRHREDRHGEEYKRIRDYSLIWIVVPRVGSTGRTRGNSGGLWIGRRTSGYSRVFPASG